MGTIRRLREIFAPMRWDLAGFALSRAHATALLAFAAGAAWPAEVSVGLCVSMLLPMAWALMGTRDL